MANIGLIYDPRYHSFTSWACLMCELYAPQQLQIPSDENAWQDWGVGLNAIDVFVNEGIPSPYKFDNWQDWAAALVGAINPRG